jgi:hypothetical protein
MLHSQASAATPLQILPPKSCANTSAATSGSGQWVDVRQVDGALLVTQITGAFTGTGSLAGKLQSATDANGTGAADITGVTFPTVTLDSNAITGGSVGRATESIAVDPKRVAGGFLGYVGTMTGISAALIAVSVHGKRKIV